MYQPFFQFERRPFNATPEARDYFPSEPIENARQTLTRCIERGEGPALLIGPVGTGKTLLCQVLAEQLKETYKIALLASGQLCSRRTLLQAILFELGLPYRDLEEGDLRLSLIDHLAPSDSCPNGMLLIIDESQTLPLRLLEEIRMITNLVRGGRPTGPAGTCRRSGPRRTVRQPQVGVVQPTFAARCYLDSLRREETFDYIRHQLSEIAGAEQQKVFTDEAFGAVYDATDGIPRLINQVCDHALIMAAVGHRGSLTRRGFKRLGPICNSFPLRGPMPPRPMKRRRTAASSSLVNSTNNRRPCADGGVELIAGRFGAPRLGSDRAVGRSTAADRTNRRCRC